MGNWVKVASSVKRFFAKAWSSDIFMWEWEEQMVHLHELYVKHNK